jgi:hypothetical protein
MKRITPYHLGNPPRALRKAQLDNIALVPASLLSRKDKYQTITNNLPKGGVLICETAQKPQISRILLRVASFLREKGHMVRILPYSLLV